MNLEQKEDLRLEGLLFKVYRRQQGSVRENFSLKTETLLKKAEMKAQNMVNLIETAGQID